MFDNNNFYGNFQEPEQAPVFYSQEEFQFQNKKQSEEVMDFKNAEEYKVQEEIKREAPPQNL